MRFAIHRYVAALFISRTFFPGRDTPEGVCGRVLADLAGAAPPPPPCTHTLHCIRAPGITQVLELTGYEGYSIFPRCKGKKVCQNCVGSRGHEMLYVCQGAKEVRGMCGVFPNCLSVGNNEVFPNCLDSGGHEVCPNCLGNRGHEVCIHHPGDGWLLDD